MISSGRRTARWTPGSSTEHPITRGAFIVTTTSLPPRNHVPQDDRSPHQRGRLPFRTLTGSDGSAVVVSLAIGSSTTARQCAVLVEVAQEAYLGAVVPDLIGYV